MIEKRLVLALVFSVLILLMWGIMFPQPKQRPLQQEAPAPSAQRTPLFSTQKAAPFSRNESVSGVQPIAPQQVKAHGLGKTIVVDRPLYKAVFSTQGGVLTSFQLKEYPEAQTMGKDIEKAILAARDEALKNRLELFKERLPEAEGVEMISIFSPLRGIFPPSFFWQEEDFDLNYSVYEIDKRYNALIFSFKANDIKVIKKYQFSNDTYLMGIEIKLINEGEKTLPAAPLIVRYGPGLGLPIAPFDRRDPPNSLVLIKETNREKIVREAFRRHKAGKVLVKSYPEAIWGGLENKYFMAVILPPDEPHIFWLEKDSSGQLNVGLKLQMPELVPGGTLTRRISLYLGPKQKEVVRAIGNGLEKSIDYGMLSSSLRIMDILKFFHRFTRNWGVAIIMLTILTKIVLLPLTQKSLRSMERMQKLQPRMKELRAKHKDDPRKQQKELMGLYKQEGVNPMGGCLPMLVQMPIFIALFTTLRKTIDLRGASFLWINDLSLPDTVCYIGGSIPLNPLPLIMGLSTFWQQKMSTADPEQAKMMMFMPLMFTFMFYNFSSGLVLYWFVQNILTLAHQYGMRFYAKKNEKG